MSEYKLKTGKLGQAVVGAYKTIEDTVVDSYKKVENAFVEAFLEKTEDTAAGAPPSSPTEQEHDL